MLLIKNTDDLFVFISKTLDKSVFSSFNISKAKKEYIITRIIKKIGIEIDPKIFEKICYALADSDKRVVSIKDIIFGYYEFIHYYKKLEDNNNMQNAFEPTPQDTESKKILLIIEKRLFNKKNPKAYNEIIYDLQIEGVIDPTVHDWYEPTLEHPKQMDQEMFKALLAKRGVKSE